MNDSQTLLQEEVKVSWSLKVVFDSQSKVNLLSIFDDVGSKY